jgi:CBS domain-containing protein
MRRTAATAARDFTRGRSSVNPQLDHIRVHDAMHPGILSCDADATLGEVAGIMATHRVHAVAITDGSSGRPAGVVSDLDVVAAIASGEKPSLARAIATESPAVSSDERLDRASQLMAECGVAHLVVVDAASRQPIGVLSTLDIAAVYATAGER